jgi:hypothetical protein
MLPRAIQSSTTDMASSANPVQPEAHGKALSLNLGETVFV